MTGVIGLGLLTVVVSPLAALIGGFFSGAIVILDSLVPDAEHERAQLELRKSRVKV